MDYFHKFLFSVIPIYLFELLAALAGTFYLNKKENNNNLNKYFVIFLWCTFFHEIVGAYSPIAYFSEYRYFGFVKGTVFERNIWQYNIYFIISFSFLIYYFKSILSDKKFKKRMGFVNLIYVLGSIIYLFISKDFFTNYSIFTLIVGSLLVTVNILLFYFRLLKTDKVLNLKIYLPIYISFGALFFYLCTIPLELFSVYFKAVNELYVNIRTNVILIANIFMYGTFITGFIVCAKDNNKTEEII